MRVALYVVFGIVLFAIGGCIAQASGDQLTRRASFDFSCAAKLLRVHQIDDRTYGVMGCNKRATYVEQCDGPREKVSTSCTWVLNGTIDSGEAPPAYSPD